MAILIVTLTSHASAAPNASFSASAPTPYVIRSQSVTLSWTVSQGATVKVNGEPVAAGTSSMVVKPVDSNTLVYELIATDATGSTSKKITFQPGAHLDGRYVRKNYAKNCEPKYFNDFLDGEIDSRYVPFDCRVVTVSNPYFYWSRPMSAPHNRDTQEVTSEMSFHLYRVQPDGDVEVFSKTGLSESSIILDSSLTPGLYRWKVKFNDKDSDVHESKLRTFEYRPDNHEPALLPTGEEIVDRTLSQSHPRIAPRKLDGNVMSSADIKGQFDEDTEEAYGTFKSATLPELPSDLNTLEASAITGKLESVERLIALAYLEPDNRTFLEQAKAWLLALSGLDPNGETFKYEKHVENARIMRTLAIGYDLLHSKIPNEKAAIRNAALARIAIIEPYTQKWLRQNPYNSHWLVIALQTVQALMQITESTSPATEQYRLEHAWNKTITTMGAWGGDADSGWGNGLHYGWVSLYDYGPAAAAYRLITGVDITQLPMLKSFGQNIYSQTARSTTGELKGTFGDYSELGTNYAWYAHRSMRLFALASQNPYDEWYHLINKSKSQWQFYTFFLSAIVRRVNPVAPPEAAFMFEDAGVTAFHSSPIGLDDSTRSSVYFRSSPIGSLNHSHADSNSFTFVSRGKPLFVSGGLSLGSDYFASPLHKSVTRATRYKNAVTFDGGVGQAEPFDSAERGIPLYARAAGGKLINFHAPKDGNWAIVTGDATAAYRQAADRYANTWTPNVKSAFRTVAYNAKQGVLLIYDYALSDVARKWEQNFVTRYDTVLVPSNSLPGRLFNIVDESQNVLACVEYNGDNGTYSSSENILAKFNNPAGYAPQYRRSFTLDVPNVRLLGVTVIKENCTTNVNVGFLDGAASKMYAHINGKESILFDKGEVFVSEAPDQQ